MDKKSSAVFTARDLDEAKAQGVVAGEVRALKWGAGIAIAAILGALGLLYQNQTTLHENVGRVQQHVVAVEERVGKVEDRLTRVEERVARVEEQIVVVNKQLATISSQLAILISQQDQSRRATP